jgi:hypothetical protein
MPARLVNIDRETPLLLAPDLRDWVAPNHLCHFIVDAVAELDLRQVKVNERGSGSEQYSPPMLMALIIYSYASGVFGSRRIDQTRLLPLRALYWQKTDEGGFPSSRPTSEHTSAQAGYGNATCAVASKVRRPASRSTLLKTSATDRPD